ncbi:MAG: hypothetical protein ACI80V_003283 [Rhodothermales bacterium]|jgi:hypothetical protein
MLRLLALTPSLVIWGLLISAPTAQDVSMPGAAWTTELAAALPTSLDTTLVDTTAAGTVLIRSLPGHLGADSVLSYRAMRVPAFGWMRDGSFFWRTPQDAEGNYRFEFAAHTVAGRTETVIARVFVTRPDQ